jgi:hypothetical protein
MDKLEKAKQAEIKKMSDTRLISKLTKAGVPMEEIEQLDRNALLNSWAEIVVAGREAEVRAMAPSKAGYDPELEREKLQFQMKQWDDELAERKLAREDEARRREADLTFEDEQLKLQKKRVELMEQQDAEERNKEQAKVKLLKTFGDALRNSVVRLGNDPTELISFLDNLERQFDELRVPENLYVTLLKPFLNERARLLVNRLDATRVTDYGFVKDYLLQQFRLVPQYFLESFNSLTPQSHETPKAFMSRLTL